MNKEQDSATKCFYWKDDTNILLSIRFIEQRELNEEVFEFDAVLASGNHAIFFFSFCRSNKTLNGAELRRKSSASCKNGEIVQP